MTGEEIQGVFNDPKVLELEGRLALVEVELRETQEKRSVSDDPEEQEQLSGKMEELRTQARALSSDMRALQRKFQKMSGSNEKRRDSFYTPTLK